MVIVMKPKAANQPPAHTIKVGTIVYNSWGTERTTVDFFEVVKASRYYIWVRQLRQDVAADPTGPMSGTTIPIPGTAYGETTKHLVHATNGRPVMQLRNGEGRVWDGREKRCNWYGLESYGGNPKKPKAPQVRNLV